MILTTVNGHTYIGYSNLLTLEEWDKEMSARFKGQIYEPKAYYRAKALGGQKYRGKKYGAGFVFPNETPQSLKAKIKEKYPFLCD